MATIKTNLTCDLQHAVNVQYINGTIFSLDNGGNTISVVVTDNGAPAELSGSVSANVIRADGGTVAVNGTLDGNKAEVTLPQAAYAIPGAAAIIIKLTSDTTVTTLAAIVVNVYRSSTETIVDPGIIIPSVQTLISQIETAVASIPADYSSLWTSLAPAFSTSNAYAAGQYVTYNGGLYRFITDHAAGSWNSAHVTAVNLGGEISDLKSAFGEINIYTDMLIGPARFPRIQLQVESGKEYFIRPLKVDSDISYTNLYILNSSETVIVNNMTIGQKYKFEADSNVVMMIRYETNPAYPPTVIYELCEVGGVSIFEMDETYKIVQSGIDAYGLEKTDVDTSNNKSDGYFSSSGSLISGTSGNAFYTPTAIHLNAGQGVIVNAKGYLTNMAIIVSGQSGGGVPLAVCEQNVTQYKYVATEDTYVRFCCLREYESKFGVELISSDTIEQIFAAINKNGKIRPSLSLFEKIGIIGDSYASGEVYDDENVNRGDFYNISWGQMIARKQGVSVLNLSKGGLTTRSWLTDSKGLALLNSSDAQNLYAIVLGINDVYSILPSDPSYIGTSADLSDPTADTLWANMGKIITAIHTKSALAKIIIVGLAPRIDGNATWQGRIDAENAGLEAIAEYFSIPYVSESDFDYFKSSTYGELMQGGHPVALGYAYMANAMTEVLETAMANNAEYFVTYPFE